MEIKVKCCNIKISPRKMRPVLYNFRGMNAVGAKNEAAFTNKKGARFVLSLIKSGIAAAKESFLDEENLLVKSLICNEGPRLKRIQPWSKGQARRIVKRTSHITLILEGNEISKPSAKKSSVAEKDRVDKVAKKEPAKK